MHAPLAYALAHMHGLMLQILLKQLLVSTLRTKYFCIISMFDPLIDLPLLEFFISWQQQTQINLILVDTSAPFQIVQAVHIARNFSSKVKVPILYMQLNAYFILTLSQVFDCS